MFINESIQSLIKVLVRVLLKASHTLGCITGTDDLNYVPCSGDRDKVREKSVSLGFGVKPIFHVLVILALEVSPCFHFVHEISFCYVLE